MMLQENNSASQKMMSTFYDLVIELDANRNITSSGHELASFLRSDLGISLEGTKFELLLHNDEDREHFLSRLQQPSREQESMTDVLHVTMSYSTSGTQIPAELFILQFASIVGHRRYLIGIRDSGEQSGVPEGLHHEIQHNQVVFPSDATVLVNTMEPSLPVLWSSEGLQQLVGFAPTVDSSLADLVLDTDELHEWLQEVINMRMTNQPRARVDKVNKFKVWLKRQPPPGNVRANCRVEQIVIDDGAGCEEDNPLLAYLLFLDPRILAAARCRADISIRTGNQQRRRRRRERLRNGGSENSSGSSRSSQNGNIVGGGTSHDLTKQPSGRCSDDNCVSL